MPNVFTLPAFALYTERAETLVKLLDPQYLAKTYQNALKLLFAIAVAEDMAVPDPGEVAAVSRDVQTQGFAANELWARGAQGGLVVVAILVAVLGVVYR